MKLRVVHPALHSGSGRAPGAAPARRPARGARRLGTATLALLSLVATACGGPDQWLEKYPQTSFAPASDFAHAIDKLQWMAIWLSVIVMILVFIALIVIMTKFRHREGAPAPKWVHGNTRLELAWTLIPAVLLAIVAVPTVQTIFATQAEPPADALTVDAVGWQWWWEFRYPMGNDTVVTANEIHVPVGRTVNLRLHSADVVHNFWVPQMGGKRYAIPGRVNSIIFTPLEPGVYYGQCAEFCGESHALMRMRLIAHAPEDFEAWLHDEAQPSVEPVPTDSAIVRGQQLVTQGACIACHTIEGTAATIGKTGPDLTHFARRRTLAAGIMDNNAQNLAAWLRDPPAIKPGSHMPNLGLSEEEIGYMVAYLQTLY